MCNGFLSNNLLSKYNLAKHFVVVMKVYNLIIVYILSLFSYKEVKSFMTSEEDSSNEETLLYFAYGSNLLAKRIHINNPKAKFFSIAKLPNFRLDFEDYKDHEYWNGSGATIVEDSESDVWGALWTFNVRDIPHLDEQEDVHHGTYQVRNVSVQTPDGKTLMARTYQITVETPKVLPKDLPPNRQPSNTYMKVILDGAFECSLPMDYIRFLETFRTNGKFARCDAQEQLGHPCNVEEST